MTRTRLFVIFGLSGVGTLGISLLLFFTLTGHEKAAHKSSTQFASALVSKDPALAPKGAVDYFDGIQANFGPVKSARVIDTRNTSHGSGQSAHTYFVGDVLLETAKGPMVVELTFNGGMLVKGYDKVTGHRGARARRCPGRRALGRRVRRAGQGVRRPRRPARRQHPARRNLARQRQAHAAEAQRAPEGDQEGHQDAGAAEGRPGRHPARGAQADGLRLSSAKGDVEKLTRCASL